MSDVVIFHGRQPILQRPVGVKTSPLPPTSGMLAGWAGWAGLLAGWLACWLAGWLPGCLAGWLTGGLASPMPIPPNFLSPKGGLYLYSLYISHSGGFWAITLFAACGHRHGVSSRGIRCNTSLERPSIKQAAWPRHAAVIPPEAQPICHSRSSPTVYTIYKM